MINLSLSILLLISTTQAQDFLSLISPFLGSGLGGNNGGGGAPGGGFGGLLSNFAQTGNNAGPGSNIPFGEFIKLGSGFLNKGGGGGFPNFGAQPPPPPRGNGGGGGPQPSVTDYENIPAPAPPPPPSPPSQTAAPNIFQTGDYDDNIDMSLTGIPNHKPRRNRQQSESIYQPNSHAHAHAHRVRARTFQSQPQFISPSIRPWMTSPIQTAVNFWNPSSPNSLFSPPVASPSPPPPFIFSSFAPITPPPPITSITPLPTFPTLEPYNPPKPQPKLLAHNTARMIREIASFSDVHHGQNEDYGSVQKLMEAFFEAVATPQTGGGGGQSDPIRQLRPAYDGTELGANRPLTNKLFESDMVLTVEQMKGVVLASTERRRGGLRRGKRKVITGAVYRWPDSPIPYRFKQGDDKWKSLIRSALAHWEKETCVRWQENGPGKDYIIFFRGSGCYSSVGRTGGSQSISIGYGCEDKGIVTHEVGHSLGFWHEQSRPNRDKYITLRKEYIIRGTDGNFERRTEQEIEDMGLPYDLGSVMHYGPNAFTNDWDHLTIETNDKKYQRTIGQRAEPSFIDVKQVNRLYCNNRCAGSTLQCENGGYPDPNNCLKCKCPPGLDGTLCQDIPHGECGGELVASPIWQTLAHRGKRKCYWRIRTQNARIRLILSNISYRCETTCKSYVEVKSNSDFQQTGFRTCCNESEITVTSEQSEVLIFSDSSVLDYETGFNMRYIQDSGIPLPKPPPSTWLPGSENRGFRGSSGGGGGSIEKFILNAIPKIRDPNKPLESIASIVTEYGIASLLGIQHGDGK